MAEEKNFETKIRKYLESKGAWVLKTWSNGVQRAGVPDLIVCYRGTFMGLEIKARNGRPSKLQEWNLEKIKEAGGIAWLLYPIDFEKFKDYVESMNG